MLISLQSYFDNADLKENYIRKKCRRESFRINEKEIREASRCKHNLYFSVLKHLNVNDED